MTTWWRCDICDCHGSSMLERNIGVWRAGQIMLALHRAVSPDCAGGADRVRVSTEGPIPSRRALEAK